MTTSLDSQAYFEARCRAIGLSDDNTARLLGAGVKSLASMVFFTTYQPGTQDDAPLIEAACKAFGVDPLPGELAIAVRRLHYEAHASYIADLKLKITATDEDLPKKMPTAERAARHTEQKTRLNGIVLEGEYECSHSLLDLVAQQHERDELKYIPLSLCTTRDQELVGGKKDASLAMDADGQLKLRPATSTAVADTSTELRLKNALIRRALSYDQAGLIDYGIHIRWIEKLFAVQSRMPPPGYKQVSLNQMLEADKALWKVMADLCRTGIAPLAGAPRPLDKVMADNMDNSQVVYYLLPLPSSAGSRDVVNSTYGADKGSWKKKKRDGPKGKGGKGNKGGGKGGGLSFSDWGWPSASAIKTKEGNKICFFYNLASGCRHSGSKCSRGDHVCARKGCGGKHSAHGCTS